MPDTPAPWPFSPWPLIQAPMAGAQDERLALAAGAAEALGSLPAAMLGPAALEAALAPLRAAGRPFNVNFFAHRPPDDDPAGQQRWRDTLAPYAAEAGLSTADLQGGPVRRPFDAAMAEVLESAMPAVVSFHFGLPAADLVARLHARGAFILSSATTPDEARWLLARGVDGVIAQGLEAGGHRGHFLQADPQLQAPTLPLLRALKAALPATLPVIAAGGLSVAADVAAAMAAGASAVQVGTAFLRCPEATTSALHRARLADADAPTALTTLFSGGLARGLVNRLMHDLGPVHPAAPPFPGASAALAPLRARAEAQGRDDFSPLWSGSARAGCRAVPAAEIIAGLTPGFAPGFAPDAATP